MDYKRIIFWKGSKEIQTCKLWHFNKSIIPKEVKIWYWLRRLQLYIPTPLKCFKWNTSKKAAEDVWHVESVVKGTQDTNEAKFLNCQENHPTFQDFIIYTKERKE